MNLLCMDIFMCIWIIDLWTEINRKREEESKTKNTWDLKRESGRKK